MLKKNILISILISFTLFGLVFGLYKINRNDSTRNNNRLNIESTGERNNKSNHNHRTALSGKNDVIYKLITENYTEKNVKIDYPQISNLANSNKQKAINHLIKTEALKVLNYYTEVDRKLPAESVPSELDLEINYNIPWKSENLLSIQYSGIGYVRGTAHPNNLFYTTNININNGSRLRLKDLINIDDAIVKKFKSGKLKPLRPEHNGILNNYSGNELLEKLTQADSLDNLGASEIFSYLTKDSLGISFSVSHAIGDHAGFEIKYQEITGNIKSEIKAFLEFSR